jgi:hypothetical protein
MINIIEIQDNICYLINKSNINNILKKYIYVQDNKIINLFLDDLEKYNIFLVDNKYFTNIDKNIKYKKYIFFDLDITYVSVYDKYPIKLFYT